MEVASNISDLQFVSHYYQKCLFFLVCITVSNIFDHLLGIFCSHWSQILTANNTAAVTKFDEWDQNVFWARQNTTVIKKNLMNGTKSHFDECDFLWNGDTTYLSQLSLFAVSHHLTQQHPIFFLLAEIPTRDRWV